MGVSVGMNKESVEARLRSIGKFLRDDGKGEQVWLVNDNPSFGHVAIGYDENDQIRYITAIAKITGGQPMLFSDVGDLTTARQEIAGPNRRYTWEIAANGSNSGYQVIAQGVGGEAVSLYTLSRPISPNQKTDENKEENK